MTDNTLIAEVPPPEEEQGSAPHEAPLADDNAASAGGDTADAKLSNAAPVQYEDFQMPEGVSPDAQDVTELKSLAKEYGLTQEQAQKVADLGTQMLQKWTNQQNETLQRTQSQWVEEAQGDPEFGGAHLPENLGIAKKALDTFGTPKLMQLLEQSGLGNHPEMIRTFYRAGKAISEDHFVSGAAHPNAARDAAEQLYPNQSKV